VKKLKLLFPDAIAFWCNVVLRTVRNSQCYRLHNSYLLFLFYLIVLHRLLYFFFVAQQPKWSLWPLIFEFFRSHRIRYTHTAGRTPLNQWSARRRGHYIHNTQQTQQMYIRALSWIRTYDPSNQAAADHRYWHCFNYVVELKPEWMKDIR
jgi:hypothetical protein